MSSVPSPRRPNDENAFPVSAINIKRDATLTAAPPSLVAASPSPHPRARQPLGSIDHSPNLFHSASRYSATPSAATDAHQHRARSGSLSANQCPPPNTGSTVVKTEPRDRESMDRRERDSRDAIDATPVRGGHAHAPALALSSKVVDLDARELPLPKGLVFAPPPPPAAALLPLNTPTPAQRIAPPPASAPSHHGVHPSPMHAPHHAHSHSTPHHHQHHLPHSHIAPLPMHTPRMLGQHHAHAASPLHHLAHATTPARSMSLSYSSPSTSHMPSTPDMHAVARSPYPPGPIDLHELLPPARFPGPLPAAFLNQGEIPSGDNPQSTPGGPDMDNDCASNAATPAARRTLVSCNPWDYRAEDHGKNKPRRRFSPGELDMLEILWSISHNPHKWQRQKLARWFGCTTRHLTVWFQNRRQDLKKAEMLLQVAESDPESASKALAAVNRANRGDQVKFTPEQTQSIMDIVSDRLLPEMWFSQQPSGSSPTAHSATTPSPTSHSMALAAERERRERSAYTPGPQVAALSLPTPTHAPLSSAPVYALKPIRRGYSLDDVCADRELSMTHRPSARSRPRVEGFEQLHKNDPRYREALINMLPSELSSDAIEPPELDDEDMGDEDSPTRKRVRHASVTRGPRPTLPPIGLGRPHPGMTRDPHRPRSAFGRASSSDVLACSSRARYLANNGLNTAAALPSRAVTDPVSMRSASAGPPPAPEHNAEAPRGVVRPAPDSVAPGSLTDIQKRRRLSRQGSWSIVPTLKHRDSFSRGPADDEAAGSPSSASDVPGQTRSPTPQSEGSSSPKTATESSDGRSVTIKLAPISLAQPIPTKLPRLPVPEGRSIYSFSTELEPEGKRGTPEMDENVLTGAHALMELLRGR